MNRTGAPSKSHIFTITYSIGLRFFELAAPKPSVYNSAINFVVNICFPIDLNVMKCAISFFICIN